MVSILVFGLIALGILIFMHELGHFLVAKAAGIRVLKFSLGFGKKLIGFKWGETDYMISVLPLGGYVKMAGENPKEADLTNLQPGDYFSRPWWVRLLVLLAGPGMNFLTAILVLGFLFWLGFMVPIARPQIMQVEPNSPAAQVGLQAGDVITALAGQVVDNWEHFSDQLNAQAAQKPGAGLLLEFIRQGKTQTRAVTPTRDAAKKLWRLGIAIAPAATNVIERVFVGTPAEMAGFQKNDQVLAVEGKPVWTKYDFQNLIWPRAEQKTHITIERAGQRLDLTVVPIVQQFPGQGKVGIIGVNFKTSNLEQRQQYPFFQAFALGSQQTYVLSKMICVSLWQMITGQISAKDSIGGPITIMRMAGQEAQAGPKDFLFFLAGISIMLAIINLLPIPVFDGGNAVFFLWEGIWRRPLSLKVQEALQRIGMALIIALMVFATYNDIYKLIASALVGSP